MSHKRIYLSPPHMSGSELGLIHQAFESNYIAPLGPMVDAFEREFAEYIGIPHCVALSSGTAAMHLALRGLGIGPGDDVIASTLTFIGSVTPVTFLGASPVFIDADGETWNMDPSILESELQARAARGKLPKAVIPTDLYGQCCDLDNILAVCKPFEVPVVCDSAEAVGAQYKGRHAGHGAYAAVYSFNGNKIITTSGGGMLASEDETLITHARKWATQARDSAPHYEHSEIGYNYRMSNILAAIGLGQLQVLDARVIRKREIYERYRKDLGDIPGLTFMPEAPYGRANRWLTVVLLDPAIIKLSPEEVRLAMETHNIETRPVWKPMHLQPIFRACEYHGGTVAETLFGTGLCLPSGTGMSDADLDRVCDAMTAVLQGAN